MKIISLCSAVYFVLFLSSCTSVPESSVPAAPEKVEVPSTSETVVGKWVMGDTSMEFLEDGQMKFNEESSGNYEVIGPNQISFAPPGESPSTFEFRVSETTLSLTAPDGDSFELVKPAHLAKLEASGDHEEIEALKAPQYRAWESEALSNLMGIRGCQEAYRAENGVYIACKSSPPDGGKGSVLVPFADAGGFSATGFMPMGKVRYQYTVTVSEDGRAYTATAVGDLDDDGVKATYTLSTTNSEFPNPVKEPRDEH